MTLKSEEKAKKYPERRTITERIGELEQQMKGMGLVSRQRARELALLRKEKDDQIIELEAKNKDLELLVLELERRVAQLEGQNE